MASDAELICCILSENGGATIAPPVPANTVLPAITGTAQVGQTLLGSNGTWVNVPTGYTYRWLANGAAIGGATNNTFLLTSVQIGKVITFEVTASNGSGSGAPVTSAATSAVLPAVPVNTVLPVITGTAQVGQTLSGSNGTWTNTPTGYAYRWLANAVAIGGATANTFLLTSSQIGKTITFEVTASNAGGSGTPATSAATAAVIDTPPVGVTNLTAVYASGTQINLAWTDNATNETSYRIYRSDNGGAYGLYATIAANSVAYNDVAATASHVYAYKVAPANSGGETLSGSVTPTVASFLTTTVGAATLTIAALTVTSNMVVDWGDGLQDTYNGAGARTHNYAGAGTYTVQFLSPLLVTVFNISDPKVTLNSADIKSILNVTDFQANSLKAGTFNSTDVSAWRPTTFYTYLPSGYLGTFNSTDVSAWRPVNFRLCSMPSGYLGTFNSTDVSAWRPSLFELFSMPSGYAGTFNSTDVSAWRPSYFYLYLMPSGYAGTFNSSDVTAWRPTNFELYLMPTATYTITITAGGFAGWVGATLVNLSADALSQASVNQILADLYVAFATRTVSGGTITLNGAGNAAPSGIFQANCPPTSGKETAYDLLNNPCAVNPKVWSTITTN